MNKDSTIPVDWPAPSTVRTSCTTRYGGFSEGPYTSYNLAAHVSDDSKAVSRNREKLSTDLELSREPIWLTQVHGTRVVRIDDCEDAPEADACCTEKPGHVCAVLTADCLPILVCHRDGKEVAAIHAGWRGLLNGVIDATINALNDAPESYLAWFGPALGPDNFEIDDDVRLDFMQRNADNGTAFKQISETKYLMDMYSIARMNLSRCGIDDIYGGGLCTYSDERFYSYREDNGTTGRMATLIYIDR